MLCLCNASAFAEEEYVVTQQVVPFSYKTRGDVRASETTQLKNPVSWKPIKFVVPNGSYIKKDEKLAEFDPLYQDMQYEKMLIEKNVVDLELETKLLDIEDRSQKFEDQIKERQGNLAVLEAKLARILSLPLKTDVAIASGKLRIANLEKEAAELEWERAQGRFEKNFLSKTELQRYQYALQRKRNQYERDHAILELTNKPAEKWDIEVIQLQIKTTRLSIEKLEFEYSKQKEFVSINVNSAKQGYNHFERRLKESKEELEKLTVLSPINGYVVYTDDFKRALDENGGKLWRNRIFVNIPHVDGMYINAIIPEHMRQLINLGDTCDIFIPGSDGLHLKGQLNYIDSQPQDIISIDGNVSWGSHDKNSGIKVYAVKILPKDDKLGNLKPHAHVNITIHGKGQSAAVIPAHFVVCKDESFYVSIDGVYEKVDGYPVNGWFQLKDEKLLGRTISLKGKFPVSKSGGDVAQSETGKLVLSGEVGAVKEHTVRVQDIHSSPKIVELVEEGVFVEAGHVIIKLDDVETKEDLAKIEETLKTKISEREKEEEEIQITKKTGNIDLQLSQYNVEIAELNLEKAQAKLNMKSVIDTRQRYENANITLKEAESNLERIRALPSDRVSSLETTKVEREFLRKKLLFEQAAIQLNLAENGVDYLGLKTAEMNLLAKRLEKENLENRLEYDLEVANGRLIRMRNRENDERERYNKKMKQLENLNIKAPVAGVVQHKVIRDSGGELSKIKKGSTVRDNYSPIAIADTSQTMVTLEVPEQAYPYVKKGDLVKVLIPSLGDHQYDGAIEEIDYIFKNKTRKDINIGLYANREPLGQAVFVTRIYLKVKEQGLVKPGMQVHVHFPIDWPIRPHSGANDVN